MLFNIPGLNNLQLNPNQQIKINKALTSLAVGKILQAEVINPVGKDTLIIKIDGKKLHAKSPKQFTDGQKLTLKVVKNSDIPILEIIDKPPPQKVINQAIRQVLPQQTPPKALLNTFKKIIQDSEIKTQNQEVKVESNFQLQKQSIDSSKLPQQVRNNLKELINSLGLSQQLKEPKLLKHFMQQSGQFLENKLLNHSNIPPANIKQDYKAQLFQLLKTIDVALAKEPTTRQQTISVKPVLANSSPSTHSLIHTKSNEPQSNMALKNSVTPTRQVEHYMQFKSHYKHESLPIKGAVPQPLKNGQSLALQWDNSTQLLNQLKQEVQHALARVQANQLHSIPQENSQVYLVDLPIQNNKNIDVIPMLIEEKESDLSPYKNKKVWSVMLAMDLENLGSLQVKVCLIDSQIQVNFWSGNQDTLKLLDTNQDSLKKDINSLGLTLEDFNTFFGLKENEILSTQASLLDIKI